MNSDNPQVHDNQELPFLPEITTIIKGAGTVFLGMVLGSALRYLFLFLIAKKLGPQLFGLFFLGFAVFKTLGTITELGLPNGMIRYVAIFQGEKDNRRIKGIIIISVFTALAAGTAVGIIIYALSPLVSVHLFGKPALALVLKYFSLILPFSAVTTMIVFTLQGFKSVKYKIYVRELFDPIGRIILVVLLLAWGYNLKAPLLAHLGVSLVSVLVAFLFLWNRFPSILIKHIKPIFEFKTLFHFSTPLLFATFMSQLLLWTDSIMLGIFKTSNVVGIYGAAQRTALMCSLILFSFHSIFAPIIADLHNRNKYNDLEVLFKNVSKWAFSLNLPLCILFIFFAPSILKLFGPEFSSGAPALTVLILGWVVHSYLGITGHMITMSGRSKLQLINNSVLVLLNVILNVYLIPRYGMVGAALATSISIIAIDIVTTTEVRIILHMHPFRKDVLKSLAAGVVSYMCIRLFKDIISIDYNSFLLTTVIVVLFTGIYTAVSFALGIRKEEKIIIKTILNRLISFLSSSYTKTDRNS